MISYTAQEIADKLGVEKAAAYGLIKFLVNAGVLTPNGERKVEGAKGKGSSLFAVTADAKDKLQSVLGPLVA